MRSRYLFNFSTDCIFDISNETDAKIRDIVSFVAPNKMAQKGHT